MFADLCLIGTQYSAMLDIAMSLHDRAAALVDASTPDAESARASVPPGTPTVMCVTSPSTFVRRRRAVTGESLARCTARWREQHRRALRLALRTRGPLLIVREDDWATGPHITMACVCAFLGIDIDPALVTAAADEPPALSAREALQVERALAGSELLPALDLAPEVERSRDARGTPVQGALIDAAA